jgi:hypothetical protein
MKPVTPCILTINGGSSIIKVALFEAGNSYPWLMEGGSGRIKLPDGERPELGGQLLAVSDSGGSRGGFDRSDGLDQGTWRACLHPCRSRLNRFLKDHSQPDTTANKNETQRTKGGNYVKQS